MNRASLLLCCVLVWASAGAADAALADELNEVTRLQHAGDGSAAMKRADAYLAANPRDAQMRFLKAVLLADADRRDDAIQILQQLNQDYPELAEPYNNLASLYAAGGNFGKARAALEEALRVNPGYATARENLGDVYAMLASQAYVEALRLEPTSKSLPGKLALVRQLPKPASPPRTPGS